MADSEDVSSPAWNALGGADRARMASKALQHQIRLEAAIRDFSNPQRPGAIITARNSVEGVRDFFSTFLATRFYTEQHGPATHRGAHRIFQDKNVVEYMLSFAGVADLFTLRQVNKTLRNQIDTSDMLQYQTHRSTNLDGFFKTAFTAGSECSKLTGITVDALFSCNTAMLGIEKPPGHFAVVLEVRFDPKLSKTPMPNRYYPYGAMFLSEPPPTEIDVFPDCCSRGTYSSSYSSHQADPLGASMALGRLQPVGKVVSTTGLTVGHLYDAIERIREEHRICPHALEIANHDENGNYWPIISFGCLLKVKPNDPVLSPRIAAGVMSRTPPPPPNWRIWDYIDAKQKAHAAGRRIPTLAEFEVSMRLESFRAAHVEEPRGEGPHHMEVDSPYGLHTQNGDYGSWPSTGHVRRPSTSHDSRPSIARRISMSNHNSIVMTPKKATPPQHRREDSKVSPERPNTAKRKKV